MDSRWQAWEIRYHVSWHVAYRCTVHTYAPCIAQSWEHVLPRLKQPFRNDRRACAWARIIISSYHQPAFCHDILAVVRPQAIFNLLAARTLLCFFHRPTLLRLCRFFFSFFPIRFALISNFHESEKPSEPRIRVQNFKIFQTRCVCYATLFVGW